MPDRKAKSMLQPTVYTVHTTDYTVHSIQVHTLYIVYKLYLVWQIACSICSSVVRCIMYGVQCTVYNVRCTMYGVQCTVYNVRCTLYSVHYILHTVHCTVYIVGSDRNFGSVRGSAKILPNFLAFDFMLTYKIRV